MRSILLASLALCGTASAQNLDNFDSGTNPNGWEWNGFSSTVVEATGGNPGGYLSGPSIQFALMPILTSGATAGGAWVGDYRANMVQEIKFDAQTFSGPMGFGPMTVLLRDTKGTSTEADDDYAYFIDNGQISPTAGSWVPYSFAIPSQDTSALPTGWAAGNQFNGFGSGFSAGYDWNDLMANVSQVQIYFNDPGIFGIGNTYDMGIDNLEIVVNTAFLLSMPNPGAPGGVTTLEVINATPSGKVYFAYSLALGNTIVNCGGSTATVGLQGPNVVGAPNADINGSASVLVGVPAGAAGRTVHLQAHDRSTCLMSNVVTHTF